jgi:hypothetical protein
MSSFIIGSPLPALGAAPAPQIALAAQPRPPAPALALLGESAHAGVGRGCSFRLIDANACIARKEYRLI